LRALAVALVVIFHAGFTTFENGFIGVDVFFVLSGFLVCNALLSEQERDGSISLSRFFSKRIKRLLPAATVTVLATLAVFYLFGSSVLLEQHLRGARAAVLYHANFFQISEATDYFADGLGQSPFEHFWSLSIEEQFYIGFPLVFFVLMKVQPARYYRAAGLFGLLAAGSLYLQLTETNSTIAYLSTFTRVYQILIGVSLAFLCRVRGEFLKRRLVGEISIVCLVLLSTNLIDLSVPMRGLLTAAVAVPLLGNLRFPAVLEWGPVVYLGKISYGIYLWHWPIVVLLQENGVESPFALLAASAVGGTSLAALSFHTFENVIRHNRSVAPRPTIAIGLAVSVAGFLVAAPLISQLEESNAEFVGATDEYLDRIAGEGGFETAVRSGDAPETLAFEDTTAVSDDSASDDKHADAQATEVDADADQRGASQPSVEVLPTIFTPTDDLNHHFCTLEYDNCFAHLGTSGTTVMLIGDSHVGMTTPLFKDWAERHEFELFQHNLGGCSWIQGVARNNWTYDKLQRCVDIQYVHRPQMIEYVDPDIIVLFSRIYDTHPKPSILDATAEDSELSIPEHVAQSIEYYEAQADHVIVIGSLPAKEGETPAVCLSRGDDDCSFEVLEYESNEVARAAAEASDAVSYVSWTELVCFDGVCPPIIDDIIVRPDGNHLTEEMVAHIQDRAIALLDEGLPAA